MGPTVSRPFRRARAPFRGVANCPRFDGRKSTNRLLRSGQSWGRGGGPSAPTRLLSLSLGDLGAGDDGNRLGILPVGQPSEHPTNPHPGIMAWPVLQDLDRLGESVVQAPESSI